MSSSASSDRLLAGTLVGAAQSSFSLDSETKSEEVSNQSTTSVTQLVHNTRLDIYKDARTSRRSGIVCTIGPASKSVEMLTNLMKAGLNVVRLNFSHGTHPYHLETIGNARKAAASLGMDICIALDTKGPEIRTGNFVDGKEYVLKQGSKVIVSVNPADKDTGTAEKFYIDYTNIVKVIKIGQIIFIDDGLVSLRVKSIGKDFVETEVENEGPVSNHKGVNLPNVNVDLPALSAKDKADLKFGVENNVDMVFASFVRKAEDVKNIRAHLLSCDPARGKKIKIISKIENHEGVQKFDSILQETDGVMVARGDLGIEIPPQKVFLAQKMMVAKCNIVGKPVIVATQMLESMIKNPRPTRAEVSDVANAVLDGSDCVMLSGETAKGKYPKEAVQMMARICKEAESARNSFRYFRSMMDSLPTPMPTQDTICSAAVQSSFEQRAHAIVVLTNSGTTARTISKFRPMCPVIAVVGKRSAFTGRQLAITRGVYPIVYDDTKDRGTYDERVKIGVAFARKRNWVQKGSLVVCVHADLLGKGFANLMRIIIVD